MPVTKRDHIWQTALRMRVELASGDHDGKYMDHRWGAGPGITPNQVAEELPDEIAERTVRDCLNAMVELGLFSKVSSNPTVYRVPEDPDISDEEMRQLIASI